MRNILVMAVCVGLLAGCATIPEEQCAQVDWYEQGFKDGRAGYGVDRLAQHREACAGVKVVPDEARYGQGRGLVWPSIAGRTTRSRRDWPDITTRMSATRRLNGCIRPPLRSSP